MGHAKIGREEKTLQVEEQNHFQLEVSSRCLAKSETWKGRVEMMKYIWRHVLANVKLPLYSVPSCNQNRKINIQIQILISAISFIEKD